MEIMPNASEELEMLIVQQIMTEINNKTSKNQVILNK
jgi:hypothetical protein